MDQLRIGYQLVIESTDSVVRTLCYTTFTPPSLPLLLPAACLVLDGWRRQELQVGFDRKGRGVL